ncbi:Methyltransferase [Diplonema papillatum]|nr:Methyltransferase [Diplonema papillatum]
MSQEAVFPFTQSTGCFIGRYLNCFEFDIGDFEDGAPDDAEAKRIWYNQGERYWNNQPSTINGMMFGPGAKQPAEDCGGAEALTLRDLSGTLSFLQQQGCSGRRALDCGAGIGRVARGVLQQLYSEVDMVEPASHLVEYIKKSGGAPGGGAVFQKPVQDFNPKRSGPYDFVAMNWCAGFITDDDLVQFLRRAKESLIRSGRVLLKENVSCSSFRARRRSASVARTDTHYKSIFRMAGLEVVGEEVQDGLPEGWLDVKMYLLR